MTARSLDCDDIIEIYKLNFYKILIQGERTGYEIRFLIIFSQCQLTISKNFSQVPQKTRGHPCVDLQEEL